MRVAHCPCWETFIPIPITSKLRNSSRCFGLQQSKVTSTHFSTPPLLDSPHFWTKDNNCTSKKLTQLLPLHWNSSSIGHRQLEFSLEGVRQSMTPPSTTDEELENLLIWRWMRSGTNSSKPISSSWDNEETSINNCSTELPLHIRKSIHKAWLAWLPENISWNLISRLQSVGRLRYFKLHSSHLPLRLRKRFSRRGRVRVYSVRGTLWLSCWIASNAVLPRLKPQLTSSVHLLNTLITLLYLRPFKIPLNCAEPSRSKLRWVSCDQCTGNERRSSSRYDKESFCNFLGDRRPENSIQCPPGFDVSRSHAFIRDPQVMTRDYSSGTSSSASCWRRVNESSAALKSMFFHWWLEASICVITILKLFMLNGCNP